MSNTIRPVANNIQPRRVAAKAQGDPEPRPGVIVKPNSSTPVVAEQGGNPLTWFQNAVRWLLLGPAVSRFQTLETVRDPESRWASSQEITAAREHLLGSKDAETAALAKLGDRAAAYLQLADICGNDFIARDVLLTWLLEGKLTSLKDLGGKGDALTYLSRMATQPLPAGMDRRELVTNALEEAADPVKISQEAKGTCVATTASIVLARKSPAEYLRLVQELSGPEGKTTTQGGHPLTRKPDWSFNNDGGRTPSVRMLSPALMELGNFFLKYDNSRDVHTLSQSGFWERVKATLLELQHKIALPGGLEGFGANRLMQTLTGDDYQLIHTVGRMNRAFAWDDVEKSLAAGNSVPVGVFWEGGGHEILLDKIEGGFVYFTNPWGEEDRMSAQEMRQNLQSANILKR